MDKYNTTEYNVQKKKMYTADISRKQYIRLYCIIYAWSLKIKVFV